MAKRKIDRRKYKNDITAKWLRDRYDYNPETGELWTKPRRVGHVHSIGRKRFKRTVISFGIRGKGNYYIHRLAWLWMTGQWPHNVVDHINGDGTDNRWCNLREATHSENMRNQRISNRNSSGLTGAFWDRWAKRWISSIAGIYLGTFPTAEAAHEAYKKAAIEKYGEFAHERFKRS